MKSSASSAPVLMQTVRRESSLRHRFVIDPAEKALYEGLRHQIPILDAAITKIVRLTGDTASQVRTKASRSSWITLRRMCRLD